MDLMRELAAVALVFGLLALAIWLLRGKAGLKWKRAGKARGRAPGLECLDRLVLSPQHALHMVRAADQVLILVTHAGGCTLLAQQPPAAPEAAALRRTAGGSAFARLAS
jgi:flagellar biogenesis protein FliO